MLTLFIILGLLFVAGLAYVAYDATSDSKESKSSMHINNNGSKIVCNGTTYYGRNITLKDDKIIIDGIEQSLPDQKEINITVEGSLENLNLISGNIEVAGDVTNIKQTSGKVSVKGNVYKDILFTSGSLTCGNVEGNVSSTSGNIVCNVIKGNVKTTSGNVTHHN